MANAPPSYGVYREFESHRYYQIWAISKMNITIGYEPISGSLILSSPSKTRQSNVWLLWHAGSEVSSLLKCGTTFTEVALAIREFFLVGKRVEGVCYKALNQTGSQSNNGASWHTKLPPQKESNIPG